MKSKRWIALFFILFFAGMAAYMVMNYKVDPLGYFTVQKGSEYYRSGTYTRKIKTDYFMRNADQYDAVIIGGSKSGVLSTELLSEYTGKRYYNFYWNGGNFYDYLTYSKYLIENTNISEITLHISSFEVSQYANSNSSNVLKVPAMISGNLWDQIREYCSYLLIDIDTLRKNINKGQNTSVLDSMITGEKNRSSEYKRFAANPKKFIKKYTITSSFKKYIKKMFSGSANKLPAYDDNLNALRELKALCSEHGVELKVMIGASFIGEREAYECDRYYDYLHELVTITDVWDFSDINDYNLNPYNFVNRRHYSNSTADLMIKTMYGAETKEGFGIYLTKDNINQYLDQRKAKLRELKTEFETTGTIALPGMDDESYIPMV